MPRALPVTILLVLLVFQAIPASAQTGMPPVDGGASLQALVEQAHREGYRIVIVPPDGTPRPAEEVGVTMGSLEGDAMMVRTRLAEVITVMPAIPGDLVHVLAAHSSDGTAWWPVLAFGLAVVFLALGYAVSRVVGSHVREHFRFLYNPEPATRTERISYLLFRVVLLTLGVAIQIAVAGVLMLAFAPDDPAWRAVIGHTALAVAWARTMVIVFHGFTAPDAPKHRLIWMSDADALGLFRSLTVVTWIGVPVFAVCLLMERLGLSEDAHMLMLVGTSLIVAVLFSATAVRYRAAVTGAILGPTPETVGPMLRGLAEMWHLVAVVYFMGAWAVSVVRLLLDQPGAIGPVSAPVLLGVAAYAAYAIALLVIDHVFKDDDSVMPVGADGAPTGRQGMKQVAEHALSLLALALYGLFVAESWLPGSMGDHALFGTGIEIALIAFLAYIAFHAVRTKIDDKIAEEGGGADAGAGRGDEGGASAASRLATLLPIFRNFLLAVIASIAGMLVLSEMGVDIAPLFAGAGVVGLAVGFGAQTLIRDIFSGAFFLMDDAFRRGEYIETGQTRGTVEKISVRSIQLRHHLGPLHTIPFGEITSLTNYSRDWVMMKLPLRLTYDTDPDKVSKLIKQLGKELLRHPEIGEKFMEPLKSQGVYQMEDSAMIIRVKFMTKPGDQFGVRKVVYSRIRELFAEHGIRFASREVTVRLADAPDQPLTEGEKQHIAGAVRPLLDEAGQVPALSGADVGR